MNFSFNANTIDVGIDDSEEVYSISFSENVTDGGPPTNYLLMQRSVEGVVGDDGTPDFAEPYIELNDPSNGSFSDSFTKATLYSDRFVLLIKPGSAIVTEPGTSNTSDEIQNLTITFAIDSQLLRKVMLAMNLVIADGFEYIAQI
jgi:hypothetical protein